jgi:hypothetical protein
MAWGTNQMNVGAGSGAVFVPINWARDMEIARESTKVMAGLVNRRDYDVLSGGDTIEVPFVSNLTASSIASGGTASFQSPQESVVQVKINRYWESSVMIEYRLSIQSKYELAMKYRGKMVEALDRWVETDLTGLYSSASQIVGGGSVAITEANIVRGQQYLNDASAPITGRNIVVCPAGMNNMVQIARFTEMDKIGGNGSVMTGANNGRIGKVFEFPVSMTTNILGPASTGTVIHHNLLFQEDFATLAIQKKPSVMVEDRPSYFGTGYIATALWGFALLRQNHLVDLQSKDN